MSTGKLPETSAEVNRLVALHKLKREEKRQANLAAHARKRAGELSTEAQRALCISEVLKAEITRPDGDGEIPALSIGLGMLELAKTDVPAAKFVHELTEGPLKRTVIIEMSGHALAIADAASDLVLKIFGEGPQAEEWLLQFQERLRAVGSRISPSVLESEPGQAESN